MNVRLSRPSYGTIQHSLDMKYNGALQWRSWDEIKANIIVEFKILFMEWKVVLFGLAWQYFHSVLHNTAYWMQTKLTFEQRMPLYDQGFELLPEFTESQAQISEYLVFGGIFGPSIILFVSVLFLKPSNNSNPRFLSLIAKRVLLQTALCLMLRCVSFLVTSLPGPAPHCRPMFNQTCLNERPNDPTAQYKCLIDNPDFQPPMTLGLIFGHIDALNGCGDLMFSSHTTYTVSFILAVFKYWKSVPLLLTMVALQIAIAFCIVAARKHYSLDVITAIYVVPMVWFILDAYYYDLNHKDAVVTVETIKTTYGIDIGETNSVSSGNVTLMQDGTPPFQQAESPMNA